ncbi:hypothetical protein LNKW23_26140 [Paralimibaculum aggregatum]|uniref:N-acetyltransferase domain-containing protein n=1 Tax=Paralimibaculum aggregatum TaxID=3036245 RepID=A0ABQ6LJG1_9RHOB|nr:GNAT family N-acetyltransferase [Limibaculum sp. NKW23]GMG83401.1 hypothetical protein LNKW23_26140 [Limibaculum sp. NKW23]
MRPRVLSPAEAEAQAAALSALHRAAFAGREPGWSADSFRDIAAMAGTQVLALPDGQGLGVLRSVAGEAELLTLAVAPAARRAGLGAALLAAVEATARADGAAEMHLEVAEGNAAARALYARAGYAARGRRRGYYLRPDGSREDALLLARALA